MPRHQRFQLLVGWRFPKVGQEGKNVKKIIIGIYPVCFGGLHQRINDGAGFCTLGTCILRPTTAGVAEQNGREALVNGRFN